MSLPFMHTYFSPDSSSEFATRERCHIHELMNDPTVAKLSVARCRVEPGVTTELHSLRETSEVYVVLIGIGLMSDGRDAGRRIAAMDCVHIPAGYPQQITNTGDEDLIFLAICSDRFKPECYCAHEEPGRQEPVYQRQ